MADHAKDSREERFARYRESLRKQLARSGKERVGTESGIPVEPLFTPSDGAVLTRLPAVVPSVAATVSRCSLLLLRRPGSDDADL